MATGQAGTEITEGHAPTLNCNHEAPIALERRFVRTTGGQPQAGVNGCLRADTNTGNGAPCVAFGGQMSVPQCDLELSQTLQAKNPQAVVQAMAVRRLTPVECERLQGFPGNFTRIPWRNKPADQCPDGPRYKALGNSMAVNCMEWIGRRIENIESIKLI